MVHPETSQPKRHISEDGQQAEFTPDSRVVTLQSEAADPAAKQRVFAEIVTEFEGPLTGYVTNMIGPNEAEDVVQTTFINAFLKIGDFEERSENGLRHWLYKITRNLTLNVIRDNTTGSLGQSVVSGLEPTAIASQPSRIGEPEVRLEFLETLSVLDRLSPIHRNVMIMSAEGYSQEEMAEAEGISIGAVKGRLIRGRGAAIRILSEWNGGTATESDGSDGELDTTVDKA